jgi:hypothetical protein
MNFDKLYIISPFLNSEKESVIEFMDRHKWFTDGGGSIVLKCAGDADKSILGLTNENIILLECDDVSLYNAWNQAFDYLLTSGIDNSSYVIFLGIDDILLPDYIVGAVNVIANIEGIDFIYGDAVFVKNGRYLRKNGKNNPVIFSRSSIYSFDINHPGMLNKWSIINKYRFDVTYQLAADFDFYVRISHNEKIIYNYLPKDQAVIGLNGVSNSINSKCIYFKEWCMIENKNNIIIEKGGVRFRVLKYLSKYPYFYKILHNALWMLKSKKTLSN